MDELYPLSPDAVPENLTQATTTYRQRAWMAMGGLALFVVLYFALTGWFGWTAYRLLSGAIDGGSDVFLGFIAGVCAAFLAVFMAKAIFFVKHSYQIDDIEITAQQQPKLFAFLNRLADEAGAPRPHRVFLSPRVNAAVFYDLSILNLILPSKKNLEIGLGLVNVLSLGEFKAVLAHEFGHFAQRSMAVGRWVYIAQQIAGHIISKRDALDSFLKGLSRFDLRIAWVGWLLSLIVWSIRSVMETVFRVVVLAQRALSREMEFQADLVAVSLTGSDAIVNALHRLNVADTAWDRAAQFAYAEARNGRLVTDVFAAQSLVIERLRAVWDNPSFREVTPPPNDKPESHRVFQNELAQPPRMWSTHPANAEREENAKRTYIGVAIDARSAWELFDAAQAVKEQMSAHIVREATKEKPAESVPITDALAALSKQYDRAYLRPIYRGTYLGRSITRHVRETAALYDRPTAREQVTAELALLYPESLTADLDKLRQLEHEKAALQALYEGFLTAPGGIIRHGGKELRRRDLPGVIAALAKELDATREIVHAHDRRCRTAHLAAATALGNGWDAYLQGLVNLLHYADHAEADLSDAQGAMHNVYAVVTADGRVSKTELNRLVDACSELYRALRRVHDDAGGILLDRTVARRLSVESWQASLEKCELPPPTAENLSQWLNVVDGWTNAATGALSALQLAALEQLLLVEAQVSKFVRETITPNAAPEPSKTPGNYPVLLPGGERERQKKLGMWDRFQTADGLMPTLARLLVAAAIIGAVVSVGGLVGSSSVIIYNGLARDVTVQIGTNTTAIPAFGKRSVQIDKADRYQVVTATADGKAIETFIADAQHEFTHYVYNIASASPLVEWTAVYGIATAPAERKLGAVQWTNTSADVLFEEPPKQINTKGGGGTRSVLSGFGDRSPSNILELLNSDAEKQALAAAHARWDDTTSKYALQWLSLAMRTDKAILAERLQQQPEDALLLRVEQDTASKSDHEQVCARHRALAAAHADNANLRYIAARCIENPRERDEAFLNAYRAAPRNGWLALAAGYTHAESARWNEALSALDHARTVSAVAEFAAMDIARIRRLTMKTPALTDLYRDADTLRFFEAIETGHELDSPEAQAYHQLSKGNLNQAVDLARKAPGSHPRLTRLVGASDGADRTLIAAALTLPADQGLDDDSRWAAYALALREHADTSALSAAIEKFGDPNSRAMLAFMTAVQQGDLNGAQNFLVGLVPVLRGHAYSAAAVLLESRCPPAWREGAKRLLFVPERPYFR